MANLIIRKYFVFKKYFIFHFLQKTAYAIADNFFGYVGFPNASKFWAAGNVDLSSDQNR